MCTKMYLNKFSYKYFFKQFKFMENIIKNKLTYIQDQQQDQAQIRLSSRH